MVDLSSFRVAGTNNSSKQYSVNKWNAFLDALEAGFASSGTVDTTAPTLSSPTAAQTGSTTANVGVTTNEGNGTLYYVVTTSATAPTALQVEAGQNNLGTAAVASGSQAVTIAGIIAFGVTGLTAATLYYVFFMHKDSAGNRSVVTTGTSFTTGLSSTITVPTIAFPAGYVAGSAITAIDISNVVLSGPGAMAAGDLIEIEYVNSTSPTLNTDGTYSTSGQTVKPFEHIFTESEQASAEDGAGNLQIDLTGANLSPGWQSPSGAGRFHLYIKRDDGITPILSSMSNQLSYNISASVAKLSKTGANRSGNLVFTNGDLTIKGNASNGFLQLSRATTARPVGAASEADFTFTTAGSADGNIWFGLDDGTSDLSAYGQTYGEGVTNNTGIMARINRGSNVLSTWRNSGTNVDYTMAGNAAVSDVYSLKADDSGAAGTHTIRFMRNGSLITTMTGLTITSFTRFLIGSSSDETLTVNFGATTLQDGGPIYG